MKKNEERVSNVISPAKFIFLSILSFGIYQQVWFYRNWKFFKEKEKLNISPFGRAWFAVFFINSLFKKILRYAKKKGYKKTYSSGWITFFWIVLLFIYNLYSNLEGAPEFLFFLYFLSPIILLAPLNASNFYYLKAEKNYTERSLKWWHVLLILLCISWWTLILMGFFFS